jgi:hypothetical protein
MSGSNMQEVGFVGGAPLTKSRIRSFVASFKLRHHYVSTTRTYHESLC